MNATTMTLFSPGNCDTVLPPSVMKISFPVRKLKVHATLHRYYAVSLPISRHLIQLLPDNVDIDRSLNFALNVKITVFLICFMPNEDHLHHSTSFLIIQYNTVGFSELNGLFSTTFAARDIDLS
jgi:hypothetical protein